MIERCWRACLIALLLALGCADDGASPRRFQSYSLGIDLSGQQVSTDAYPGQVVVVCFWATWAPPSRRQLAALDSLQIEFPDMVHVAAVSLDTMDALAPYLATHPLGIAVSRDPDLTAMRAITSSGLIPTTILLDSHGRIRSEDRGLQGLQQLRDRVMPLLSGN